MPNLFRFCYYFLQQLPIWILTFNIFDSTILYTDQILIPTIIKSFRWAYLNLVAAAQYQVYTNSNSMFYFKKSTCIINKPAVYLIIFLLLMKVIIMLSIFSIYLFALYL